MTILVPNPFVNNLYPEPTYTAGVCSKCGIHAADEDIHTAWHREFVSILLDFQQRLAHVETPNPITIGGRR